VTFTAVALNLDHPELFGTLLLASHGMAAMEVSVEEGDYDVALAITPSLIALSFPLDRIPV